MSVTNAGTVDYDALAASLLKLGFGQGVFGVVSHGATACGSEKKCGEGVERGGVGGQVGVKSDVVVAGEEAVVGGGVGVKEREGQSQSVVEIGERKSVVEESVVASDSGSDSAGSGGLPGEVSEVVRKTVRFGGFSDEFGGTVRRSRGGFFSEVVRREQALSLKKLVERLGGAKLPKVAMVDLAMCTFAAGCMPDAFVDGKARLRSLASVGDAAITMHLVVHVLASGKNVESAQAVRSRVTSNKNMIAVMQRYGFLGLVSYPSGVDPGTTVATATAFEAVVGVLALYRPIVVVQTFLANVGVLY